jgi:hypothetical protein
MKKSLCWWCSSPRGQVFLYEYSYIQCIHGGNTIKTRSFFSILIVSFVEYAPVTLKCICHSYVRWRIHPARNGVDSSYSPSMSRDRKIPVRKDFNRWNNHLPGSPWHKDCVFTRIDTTCPPSHLHGLPGARLFPLPLRPLLVPPSPSAVVDDLFSRRPGPTFLDQHRRIPGVSRPRCGIHISGSGERPTT